MPRWTIRPINSILFISDRDGGVPPEPVRGADIAATSSCISFRCFPEQDGPTEVVLGESFRVEPASLPAFDGELETPHRTVVISTTDFHTVLETGVPDTRTRVRIWFSHPQWPDKVIIGLT
jgi:hypothetical protein